VRVAGATFQFSSHHSHALPIAEGDLFVETILIGDAGFGVVYLEVAAVGVIGAFYGFETSSSSLGALGLGPCYGFIGVAIGAPLAFTINITRNWR
jgi:hypothetical protein